MVSLPELAITLQGVDSDTQAAIQSDEDNFYCQNSSSSSDGNEHDESDGEVFDSSPNLSHGDIQDQFTYLRMIHISQLIYAASACTSITHMHTTNQPRLLPP